jgi:hypothetical protein
MATPRRRLTLLSTVSQQKSTWVEKRRSDKSPRARALPECCQKYQQRLEAAAEEIRLIKENGEPEEAIQGPGEVAMAKSDPVRTKLQELTQQMVHVVQACNDEKGLIEDEFVAVRQDLDLLKSQILTEKAKLEGEVSGVGSQMIIQQAVINEMRQGISILQKQDNIIIKEAADIFTGIRSHTGDSVKEQTESGSTLLNHRRSIMKIQDKVKTIKLHIDSMLGRIGGFERFTKELPTKEDLAKHTKAMDETLAKFQEVSTGLTVHLDESKLSESTPHRPRSVAAGPSFTHPDRRQYTDQYYYEDESISTRQNARDRYDLRGSAGSNDEESDDPNVPEDTPLPPGTPPPGPPQPSGRRRPKTQAKSIQLKDPYPFEGKTGEDFDAWWFIVQTFIQDQPEKFED